MREEERRKLRKLVDELQRIRGRHTELISVYIPSGYNLVEMINMLESERSTAMNIKSKTTRKNVLAALEKILHYLRLLKELPENGLVVFCGNVSEVEGKTDIKLWAIEPPEKLETKFYWCDQSFVLEPLKEMLAEKEVYGLIVLDASEASIGLLKGKKIIHLKRIESLVPAKTIKGGMCVKKDTLLQLEDGSVVAIEDLEKVREKILSYSFEGSKPTYVNSYEIFKRRVRKAYELTFEEEACSLILTEEHRVFVATQSGIKEKPVAELKVGDKLLSIQSIKVRATADNSVSKGSLRVLGSLLRKGRLSKGKIIIRDKDPRAIEVCRETVEKVAGIRARVKKVGNWYEMRIPKGIDEMMNHVLKLSDELVKEFLEGFFDVGNIYRCDKAKVRVGNRRLANQLHLTLKRFSVRARLRESRNGFEVEIDEKSFGGKKRARKVFSKNLVTVAVKEKKLVRTNETFYDLYVPRFNCFFANGILVHNSQRRYDRIREDAINEYLKKVGEIASNLFLQEKELKGVIVGGPGYIKEMLLKKNYLHYQVRNKILGVKDTGYTGEYGLEELVDRAQDLLKEASVAKEKELVRKFFTEVKRKGNVVYKLEDVVKALSYGAVDTLLISDSFDKVEIKARCGCGERVETVERNELKTLEGKVCEACGEKVEVLEVRDVAEKLIDLAKKYSTKIEYISTETKEGEQFKSLGGVGAFLRFKVE